ncbi:MAG: DUF5665 domain-containing protein [Methylococcaceae bacterium]
MKEDQKPSVDTALADEIARLSFIIQQQNSWSRRLFLGTVQGIGTVIGATIVAGIVLSLLSAVVHQIPWGDVLTEQLSRVTAR